MVHSYNNYEAGYNSYVLFAISGLIVLTLAFFHPIIKKSTFVLQNIRESSAVFSGFKGASTLQLMKQINN